LQQLNQFNRNLAANFRFFRNFGFLVPISKGEKLPVLPPADAHEPGDQKEMAHAGLVIRWAYQH